jgi:hypothetical protein
VIFLGEETGEKRKGGGRQERQWASSFLYLFISECDYCTSVLFQILYLNEYMTILLNQFHSKRNLIPNLAA